MFESYIISQHAIERYMERVNYNKRDVMKRIRNDLSYRRVVKIINNGDARHVFTYNSKEFIFTKERGRWILRTVIKRSRNTNSSAIQKRIMSA